MTPQFQVPFRTSCCLRHMSDHEIGAGCYEDIQQTVNIVFHFWIIRFQNVLLFELWLRIRTTSCILGWKEGGALRSCRTADIFFQLQYKQLVKHLCRPISGHVHVHLNSFITLCKLALLLPYRLSEVTSTHTPTYTDYQEPIHCKDDAKINSPAD